MNTFNKPFIIYWNNIPTPYIVDRFNAIADRGDLNFVAWFNERTKPDRSWTVCEADWRFDYRYVPSCNIAGRKLFFPPIELIHNPPDVLVSLYAEPCFIFGWAIARLLKVKTGFWCQVTMDGWVKRHAFKDAVKRYMFRRVDATMGSGEESREFAIRCGARPDRAMRLPHVIDLEHYQRALAIPEQEKAALRNKIGLQGVTFVYVGRLWWGKGLGYLLDAFKAAQNKDNVEMSLLILGDGPEESLLKEKCLNDGIENVFFEGFIQKEAMPAYYAVADAMVFPTLGDPYGLVLDEAMAAGMPLISTNAAGDVIDRIDDGINGYIVPAKNAEALAQRMHEVALNAELRMEMGAKSAAKIEGKNPKKWAENFSEIVNRIMSMP